MLHSSHVQNLIMLQWYLEVNPLFIFSISSHFQVMATTTSSSPKCWFLGKLVDSLSCAHHPTEWDVLSLHLFHYVKKKAVSEDMNLACGKALTIWKRTRILTQQLDACVRKLRNPWQIPIAQEIPVLGENQIMSRCSWITFRIYSMLPQAIPSKPCPLKKTRGSSRYSISTTSCASLQGSTQRNLESRPGMGREEQEAALKERYDEWEARFKGQLLLSVPAPQRQRTHRLKTTTTLQASACGIWFSRRGPRTSSNLMKLSVPWIESVF